VDGRMHLYGAERGTLWIDADRNRRADGIVEYRDTDSDGFFDEWQVDENADGTPERTFRAPGALRAESGLVPWDWRRVAESYRPLLRRAVDGQASVAAALGLDLTPHAGNGTLEDLRWALENRIRSWFASEIAASRAASDVGRAEGLEHVRASWEAGRFEEAVDRMAGTARGAGRP